MENIRMDGAMVSNIRLLETTHDRRKGPKDRRSPTRNMISLVNGPDRRKPRPNA